MSGSSPRKGNSKRAWAAIAAVSALMIFAGATLAMNANGVMGEPTLSCGNAEQVLKETRAEIKEVAKNKDLSENQKAAKNAELREARDTARNKAIACEKEKKGDDDGVTTTAQPNAPPAGDGTTDAPYGGTQGNTNPIFGEVESWIGEESAARDYPGGVQAFWNDVAKWPGIPTSEIALAIKREKSGSDYTALMVSGCHGGVSEAQGRQIAAAHGSANADSLLVFFHEEGIWNSYPKGGRVTPKWDDRCQARLVLLTPSEFKALKENHIAPTKGAFKMCGNLFSTEGPPSAPKPATPVPQPSGPTPTQPPATVPPTSPPVTSPPVTSPPVTYPPTTAPPVTTTKPVTTTLPPKLCGGPGQPSCTGTPSR